MSETEYKTRSKLLFEAAEREPDPLLREALYLQSTRVGMKAIALEVQRKQNTLLAMGVYPVA